jgi:hypothetical protein
MDMEQRIGRIHRYGQAHTAQVYNLVLSDTIEGRIFLLLEDKLNEIARTDFEREFARRRPDLCHQWTGNRDGWMTNMGRWSRARQQVRGEMQES